MENLSGKTLSELNILYESKMIEYNKIEDTCLKERLPWSEAEKRLKDTARDMWLIEQEKRLKQEPEITFGREWKGQTYTFEQFSRLCKEGMITDSDGYGYYATEKGKSDIEIYPSDILYDKFRKDFSHVIWMNK